VPEHGADRRLGFFFIFVPSVELANHLGKITRKLHL
jgi:hypothetical protein